LNNYLIDTNIITNLLRPNKNTEYLELSNWFEKFSQQDEIRIYLPEVCYYEALRGREHITLKHPGYNVLDGLEELGASLDYLPMTTEMWVQAAKLWAERKFNGQSTGKGIDGDTLLGAQAIIARGTVITYNTRHFQDPVLSSTWQDLSNSILFDVS